MLQDIRDNASGWVVYTIIGLLILSFALWGIQEYFGGGAGLPVANVNGNEITQNQLNQSVQERKQMLQSVLGANYEQQYPNDGVLRQQVIQDMVRTELLRQEVDDAGFTISDANLIKRIQAVPQFQTNGKFDPALYKRILESQRLNQAQWEFELREQDKLRQFEAALAQSSFLPKADLKRFQKISEQTRDFKYALVTVNQEGVELSDADLESYYNENKQLFKTPEQVKLSYVELKEQDLTDSTAVTAEDAKSIYEGSLERYMSPELRKVSTIMFKVPKDIGEDAIEWDEAMDKAKDLAKQIKDGADFAALAKEHSEDTFSAEKGGDIGFIALGDFTSKDLEDELFGLAVGGVSKPVKTERGVQIVKLTDVQAPEQESFESVREKIINERKSELAQQRFIEVAEEMANMVVEQPDDLQDISESFDLPIKQSELLNASSNEDLFAYPIVKNLAFSNDILVEKLNSDLVEVADGHVLAFRIEEHQEAEQLPFEKVKEDIKNFLTVKKAAEQTTKLGGELFLKMRGGESLENIAKEHNLEIISHGAIRRDDNRVPAVISKQAFAMEKPSQGNTWADGVSQADGSFALIELSDVKYGSEEIDETAAQQLSQRVNYGRREFSAIMDAIQSKGDVTIFEEQVSEEQ